MSKNKKVQLNLNIPKSIRLHLQRIAAQRTLENPEMKYSASGVAAEILVKEVDLIKEKQGESIK